MAAAKVFGHFSVGRHGLNSGSTSVSARIFQFIHLHSFAQSGSVVSRAVDTNLNRNA